MTSKNGTPQGNEVWFLNRTIVVLRPRQPYIEWANGFDGPKVTLDEAREDAEAFLIPAFEHDRDAAAWVRSHYDLLFEIELGGWHSDPAGWPEERSWRTFMDWFDAEVIGIAWDLVDEPLDSTAPPPGRQEGS